MKHTFLKTITAGFLAVGMLCGCGSSVSSEKTDEKKIRIVTTIFPEYDWVKEILGANSAGAEVVLLPKNGADIHSYQASASDIAEIVSSDIFIYVGGSSDEWVRTVLENNPSDERTDICLSEELKGRMKTEEQTEGMTAEKQEEEHGTEYDEHVWLSLNNAILLCDVITEALTARDPGHAEFYRLNNTEYIKRLKDLDTEYAQTVREAKIKTVLFADRFPFRYLTDDYGLTYYAAFPGCSAESEASFETIIFLAEKMDELKLPAILTIEGPQHTVAETVRMNTKTKDAEILTMNSMQSFTQSDTEGGMTYISVMEENLEVLRKALGAE